MKKLTISNREIDVCEDINEVDLQGYIGLLELFEISDKLINEQFIQKFIPIISSLTEQEVSNLYEEDLIPFIKLIGSFSPDNFKMEEKKVFEFNGVNYTAVIPNKLTFGEIISQKLLTRNSNQYETLLNTITILLRPALITQNEFGDNVYTPVDFDGNIDTLNRRKEMFKKLPAINALWIYDCFLNGRKNS